MALSDVQLLDFLSRMPFIDTVLVVADSLTYSAPEARRVLADAAPEAFLTVTCGPLVDNEQASFRLYRGATPEDHGSFEPSTQHRPFNLSYPIMEALLSCQL